MKEFVWILGWTAIISAWNQIILLLKAFMFLPATDLHFYTFQKCLLTSKCFRQWWMTSFYFPDLSSPQTEKENKTAVRYFQGFPGKIMLCCSLLCNHSWNYFFPWVTESMLWTPSVGMHLSQKNIKSSVLEGISPFLGSAQVLNFGRKNLCFSNTAVTTSAAVRSSISNSPKGILRWVRFNF